MLRTYTQTDNKMSLLNLCKIFIVLQLCFGEISMYEINDTNVLIADLMKGYNKQVRGKEDQTTPTELYFKFSVTGINRFDEVTGTFSVAGYFDFIWSDERMKWNKSMYNGVSTLSLPQSKAWTPVLVHVNGNSENGLRTLGADWMLVRYISLGVAYWYPGDLFNTHCSPVIRDYPYDKQVCKLEFVAWGYSFNEIKSIAILEKCITDLYVPNGVWDLTDTRVYVEVHEDIQLEVIIVEFQVQRRPAFLLFSMILPIAAMGVLNLFVFVLPPESGERVGYSITLLLAICVFLTIASDNLPKVSYPEISLLCIKLLIDMIISSFVVLFTVVGLRIYSKDQNSRVPSCISSASHCILCLYCRKTNNNKKKVYVKKEDEGESPSLYIRGQLSRITQEEADAEDYVTKSVKWKDVGKASDIVFFIVTLLSFAASHLTYFMYLKFKE